MSSSVNTTVGSAGESPITTKAFMHLNNYAQKNGYTLTLDAYATDLKHNTSWFTTIILKKDGHDETFRNDRSAKRKIDAQNDAALKALVHFGVDVSIASLKS